MGIVIRSGYCFQMWLPDAAKQGVAEAATGGAGVLQPDAALSEVLWCAYAWPVARGQSGNRAFFVNQSGDVMACANDGRQYSGFGNMPPWQAAFAPDVAEGMASPIVGHELGHDGQAWNVVN